VSKKWGAALGILGVAYSLAAFGIVIPHYAEAAWARKSKFIVRYTYLLQDRRTLAGAIAGVPIKALGMVTTSANRIEIRKP